jgi:hypothetical protein
MCPILEPSWAEVGAKWARVGPKLAEVDPAAMSDRKGDFGRFCADMQNDAKRANYHSEISLFGTGSILKMLPT